MCFLKRFLQPAYLVGVGREAGVVVPVQHVGDDVEMDPLYGVGEGVEDEEQQHQPTPAVHVHLIRVLDLHVLVGGRADGATAQSDLIVVLVAHLDVFR